MSQDGKLIVFLHSDSLDDASRQDKEAVDILLQSSGFAEFDFISTPTNSSIPSLLDPTITRLSYEDMGDGRFVARMQKNQADRGSYGFHDSLKAPFYSDVFGCKEGSLEFDKIKNAFHDLLAFQSITELCGGEAIFVTQYDLLLERNLWIQRRFNVKILSFVQSLEYMDLDLKRRNIYYARPHVREIDGRAFHYWFLLKYLVPRFADAWTISVFGETAVENGPQIKDVLSGLADRFENAICASDRIAMEFMKRPVNSTEWEMLYNFNYFCLLATGIFDALAWLTVHRYSMPVRSNLDVSLQMMGPKSRGTKFVNAISLKNASLASFIQQNEDLIKLFYPMRHSAQHREPVGGAQFEDRDEGWTASVARIKSDATLGIQKIDINDHPFSRWGLHVYLPNLLEPYKFTRRALRELIGFSNNYLDLLDFPSLPPSEDLKRNIANASSKDPETCFLAKIYWKRESNLPLLFRSSR